MTPSRISAGATSATSNDSAWTISVVPTLAPSITASAGTRATAPPAAKPATIRPVAVLLCRIAVTPRPAAKARQAVAQRGAEPAAQVGAEAALDAGLHHVHAPQQQRDRAGEIEQGPHGRQFPGPSLRISDR